MKFNTASRATLVNRWTLLLHDNSSGESTPCIASKLKIINKHIFRENSAILARVDESKAIKKRLKCFKNCEIKMIVHQETHVVFLNNG